MPSVTDPISTHQQIDRLAAPARSGEVLIWPAIDEWPRLLEENFRKRRNYQFEICSRSFGEWAQLGDQPVIASGHQPEFFHPGVWIKNALVAELANRLHAKHEMLVVDADAPTSFSIGFPVMQAGELTQRNHRLEGTTAAQPFECMTDVAPQAYENLFAALHESFGADEAMLEEFRDAFLQSEQRDYVSRWQAGMSALDAHLGIPTPTFHRITDIFDFAQSRSRAAAAFTVEILRNANAFRAAYNAALADYRRLRGMHGTRHPMPDLDARSERIELPFWLLNSCQVRRRLWVETQDDTIHVFAEDEPAGTVATKDLIANPSTGIAALLGPWQLRPRAIAQTAYYRLFECDLFVHGIGGAKYDAVTDGLLAKLWNIEPPAYTCASATLRLPLPMIDDAEDQLRAAQLKLRNLRFNPQRFLTGPQAAKHATLLAQRTAAIERSRLLAINDRKNRTARREAYDDIRRANADLEQIVADEPAATQKKIDDLQAGVRQNRIAAQREWFVGLYPAASLEALASDIKQRIATISA